MKGVSDTTGLKPFDNAGAPRHLVGLSKKNLRFEVKKEHVEAKTTPVHVLVVAPEVESKRPAGDEFEHLTKRLKLIAPKTLTDFTKLSVNKNEFQLDSLRAKQNSDWPIVETPGLHTFWEGFGEFPLFYFVRMEEVVFWEVIKKLLFGKDRVVIIGSPGVGKSCFLMLIAFHLACTKNKKVLVIRRLKQREEKNAVVYFDGQGSYARLLNLSSNDILAIRSQTKGAIVLVDGFDQAQVEEVKNEYVPFSFLATSCQFDAKQDDSSRIVVLPAWRDADLLQYAKLTDWVVETGWRKTKRLEDSTWPKLVKKQYFYSGGSLREFCREREELQIRVASDCCSVKNGQAFDLVYNYGGGQSSGQVDRLRRHYITDCHEEAHYYDHRWWKLSVDSGYVLGELGWIIDSDKQLEVYQYAKSVGAGFHGVAYELLLHSAVRGAFAKRKPIVLKMREGSRYEKIEIRVPNVVCSGDDEASCYHHLSKLGKETYWHPNYPFFPFIDAVTTCKAFPGGSDEFDPIVAYIQVTIRTEKKFKQERLRRLNKEMNKNELLKGMKRAFVVVGPDSSVCKNFNLRNAPDSFLAMVGCFSPDQLKPEAS
ncbi:hypothetical protein PF002_g4829 [Phytophthora fragariae]|uniref:Uncharacterized protein n=1 Tax=Phytophthora fragariae TaxID=53985 RepID=A0A6A4A4J2_9STRA|nr:hypothetical protein PF002_g4829 [Phytophthora fragariae]